jgi:hypothetical protein
MNEDENLLKKLADMSRQISSSSGKNNDKNAAADEDDEKKTEMSLEEAEKAITRDLNKFLKQHNVKDGNLVETKRIDLRPAVAAASASQTNNNQQQQHIYSKQTIESIFRNMIIKENDSELFERQKELGTFKYLNENNYKGGDHDDDDDESSSSSESESKDDGGKSCLWIERYRKQKAAAILQNKAMN